METFNLKLTVEQIVILDRALQEAPYRVAAPIIATINEQIREQQTKQQDEQQPSS